MYKAEELVEILRGWGFELFVGEDGIVHGKRQGGVTLEMRPVIEQLQVMNDEVAGLLKKESDGLVRYEGISVDEAVKLGGQIKEGRMELVGKVVYHRRTGRCDLTVRRK